MFVKYGDYEHPSGEASFVFNAQALRSKWRGYRYAMVYTVEIQGELSCHHPTLSIAQQVEAFVNAYSEDGKTFGLYFANNAPTRHVLDATDPALVSGPHIEVRKWPKGDAGEYGDHRSYHVIVSAEYASYDENDPWPGIVRYQERFRWQGEPNLPQVEYLYDQDGVEYMQVLATRFPLRLVQTGEAVGYGGWTLPLGALFPGRVMPHMTEEIYHSPTFGSNYYNGGQAKEYETSWQYVMTVTAAQYGADTPVSR